MRNWALYRIQFEPSDKWTGNHVTIKSLLLQTVPESLKLNIATVQPNPIVALASTWDVKQASFKKSGVTDQVPGSIAFEVLSLLFPEFTKETFPKGKKITGIDSAEDTLDKNGDNKCNLSHEAVGPENMIGTDHMVVPVRIM